MADGFFHEAIDDSHQPSAMTEPHHDELEALMCEYLAGRIEAFDGLYAALGTRLRAYLISLCRDSSATLWRPSLETTV